MLKGVKQLKRQKLSLLLAVFKPVGGNGIGSPESSICGEGRSFVASMILLNAM
jgi:hypothetical protein